MIKFGLQHPSFTYDGEGAKIFQTFHFGFGGVTRKIRVGTLVTSNIYRNPAVLAKMGATVDALSNGRLFMGIGAGWFETEANAEGILVYAVPERLRKLEEVLLILKGMWTHDRFSFLGKYYRVTLGPLKQAVRKIRELINARLQYLIFNIAYENEERVLKLLDEVMPEVINS